MHFLTLSLALLLGAAYAEINPASITDVNQLTPAQVSRYMFSHTINYMHF
jgi:hypothetical protein